MDNKTKAKHTAIAEAAKNATAGTPVEIIVREGAAIKHYEPQIVNLSGTIQAPGNFIALRKNYHEKEGVHVLFSKTDMSITLVLDEREHFKTTIKGSLIKNPDLEYYGINKDKIYTIADLQRFLRMRRSHFTDKDKNLLIVDNLSKFKATVSTDMEQQKTTRGESKNLHETKIKTDLALDFELNMPIFKGCENKKFKVEICFSVRDASVDVWLESPELQEIIDRDLDAILKAELTKFEDFVVIEQ